jgi:tetratricopeptide (TPR) repeat protein
LREDMRAGPASLNSIAARREYYRACHAEMQQDFAAQRRHLEEASLKYDADPDILIAMYRSPGADEEFQQRTRAKIAAVTKSFQMQIDEDPDRPSSYNQWAWLVANTEGDQERAVKYSLRSLELSPEEPSYLDTLGRCYYAVGDLENAVKSQRRAIELAPHYQVMQRQLELFEQALAAKSVDGKR